MAKLTLTEATMLALQGKLELNESVKEKTESIDISITDDNMTVVDTDEGTVVVQTPVEEPIEDEITDEVPKEVVEVPVEGDETIVPEEDLPEEVVDDIVDEEPTIDEIVDGETEADEEDLEESKKVKTENVEIEVDSEDGSVEVTTDEGEEVEVKDETPEEPVIDATEEVVEESKKVKTEGAKEINAEMSDEEIAKYIASNFGTITGIDVDTIFNPEAEQKENGVFNQTVIEKASDIITPILDKAGIEGKRLETVFEKLDDELALLQESKKVVTEAAGEFSGKLYDYFDEMGYMDGAQGEIINAFISWLSEDEIKRFAEIYEYPIFDEEEEDEDLDESKKITESEEVPNTENGENPKSEETVPETEEGKEPKSEEEVPNAEESKIKVEKFNKKSFNEAITRYFKSHNKVVESFKTTKLSRNDKGLKIEGVIANAEGVEKTVELKLNKVQEDNNYTRYIVSESKGILKESADKLDKINMVTKVNDNILECHYMINRISK